MNNKVFINSIFGLMLVSSMAAGCGTPELPAEEPPDPSTATPSPSPLPTVNMPATQTAAAAATQAAQDATITQEAQATASHVAVITQMALDRAGTATMEPLTRLTATQSQLDKYAQVMATQVAELNQAGLVSSVEGDYYRLEDFEESWAQLNYYDWWPTDKAAESFVMSGKAFVSSASDNADWFSSACGISFSLVDNDNHDILWIAMDGRAYLMSIHKGNRQILEIDRWGQATKTNFIVRYLLVVDNQRVTLFIDDKEILSVYDRLNGPGIIANTLVSGTNKDYGTRCKMSDTDLWIIK